MTQSTDHSGNAEADGPHAYEVLARKYRPRSFADLIGHGAMVRTLENAFSAGRIAHAYILTGVRGVGKTTTARILARALNYQTTDNKEDSGPTIHMEADGIHCQSIAQSRHPDVLEMDAASRTGVGDIRELIEGVRYAPIEARYKVYIIDEVHMLSTAAFNALLKTLEEPPPHVKFIFATTEIRKVPVTVLSRCQRFDLRRIDPEMMVEHLRNIAKAENVTVSDEGYAMIARAAEGSVRDALSILDQALVQHASGEQSGEDSVSAQTIREMLGLADRSQTWDLLAHCLAGRAGDALALFKEQYDIGADPQVIVRDLLELVHLLTRIKAAGPNAAGHGPAGTADAGRATQMVEGLSMNALTRAWSLLMKGLEEIRFAPDPASAGEMALIRLCYASDLPTPDEALRLLKSVDHGQAVSSPPGPSTAGASPKALAPTSSPTADQSISEQSAPDQEATSNTIPFRPRSEADSPKNEPATSTERAADQPVLDSLKDIAAMATRKKEKRLRTELEAYVHIVKFERGRITLRLAEGAPADLTNRLTRLLKEWTGDLWSIIIVDEVAGDATLRETRDEEVRNHPMIKRAMDLFPGSKILRVRDADMMVDDHQDDHDGTQDPDEDDLGAPSDVPQAKAATVQER